jgi:hypothetical protein
MLSRDLGDGPEGPDLSKTEVKVAEFGASITYTLPPLEGALSGLVCDRLIRMQRSVLDHSCHQAFGIARAEGCDLCTWAACFERFWATIAFAVDECSGCGQVQWMCGYSCEFWENY